MNKRWCPALCASKRDRQRLSLLKLRRRVFGRNSPARLPTPGVLFQERLSGGFVILPTQFVVADAAITATTSSTASFQSRLLGMCRNRRRRPGPGSRSAFSPIAIGEARHIVAVPATVAPGSLENLHDLTLLLVPVRCETRLASCTN